MLMPSITPAPGRSCRRSAPGPGIGASGRVDRWFEAVEDAGEPELPAAVQPVTAPKVQTFDRTNPEPVPTLTRVSAWSTMRALSPTRQRARPPRHPAFDEGIVH